MAFSKTEKSLCYFRHAIESSPMTKTILIFISGFQFAIAQNEQKEINSQVWEPFIQTFNTYDTEGFMALHSKDLVRSPREANSVVNWDTYFAKEKKNNERDKVSNTKREIDLRFLERVASTDQAIDIGIYQTTYTFGNGKKESYYGKFFVVLRKEKGIWKILVDTDSTEGGSIDEKSFLAAKSMNQ